MGDSCSPVAGDVPTIGNLSCIFQNVVQSALALAGILLFILLLSGGFRYITSGGDPKAIESAQKTLTYAVLGLVLILVSYLILVLIRELTGVDVTQFKITL